MRKLASGPLFYCLCSGHMQRRYMRVLHYLHDFIMKLHTEVIFSFNLFLSEGSSRLIGCVTNVLVILRIALTLPRAKVRGVLKQCS